MLSNKLFSVIVMFCVTVQLNAQNKDNCTFSLSGKVIDEHDKSALLFANIYIKELETGAVSDTNGNYIIDNICPGKYTVVVSHVGCEPIEESITINGNKKKNFFPEHHAEELGQFSLVEEAFVEEQTVSRKELSAKELHQSSGKSLGESLKKITGVTALNTGNSISKPVIHGLHSDRVLILNNGIRQEGQQWGNEHAPEIDPYIANRLSVIKGAEGIRYGANAIAGVVLVEPKALRDSSGMNGELNLAGASNGQLGVSSGMLEGNIGKLNGLSWRVQGTLKRSGNVSTPNYFMKNTGLKEYNFSWAAGYLKPKYGVETFYSQFNTDIGIFSAAHIGNLTDLQRAIDADEPLEPAEFTYDIERPYQHIEHELFKVKSYWLTGNAGKLEFVYARQYNLRQEYDKHVSRNDSIAALNLPELQFEITSHTGELAWTQNRKNAFKAQAGIAGIYQANTVDGRQFIPAFIKYGAGIYFIEKWRSKNRKLELEAGIRYDYIYQQVFKWENRKYISPEYIYNNTSGSVGAVYKPTDKLSARINYGMAWRPPNVSELYSDGLHHGAAAVEYGDTNLVAERAHNTILGIDYVTDKWLFQIEGYYNFINDFIYLKPDLPPTLTIRGAFPTFRYEQVNAAFTGVDFKSVYKVLRQWSWNTKASIINAQNLETKEGIVGIPANRVGTGIGYELKKLGALEKIYADLDFEKVFQQNNVPEDSDYSLPPKGYSVVNFNTGFDIPTFKNQKLTVDFEINNVLNTVYRDYLNRFRYYADELGRNYSLKLKLTF